MKQNLKKYLSASSALVAGATVNAQIVYTDLNPDINLTQHGDTFALDLDGNSINDYKFKLAHVVNNTYMTSVYPDTIPVQHTQNEDRLIFGDVSGANNGFLVDSVPFFGNNNGTVTSDFYWNPRLLNSNDPIKGAGYFYASSVYMGINRDITRTSGGYEKFYNFSWADQGQKFIGLKLPLNATDTLYGWIRVSMDSTMNLTIYDYAYESTANTGLLAGEGANTSNPPALNVLVSSTDETTPGSCDGSASLTISGGTPPYTTVFDTLTGTTSFTNLCPGFYSIQITDANSSTVSTALMIAAGANIVDGTSNWSDSIPTDTVTFSPVKDCDIDYDNISTVQIVTVHQNLNTGSYDIELFITYNNASTETKIISTDPNISVTNEVMYGILSLYCDTESAIYGHIKIGFNFKEGNVNNILMNHVKNTSIYPNPAKNTLYVKNINNGSNYKIMNSLGQEVTSGIIKSSTQNIDISKLIGGVYFMGVIIEDKLTVFKFTKN